MSYLRGIISYVPQPRIPLFWFTSSGVHKQHVLFEVLAPAFFILQGSHVQRQYWRKVVCLKDYLTHLNLTIARKGRWVISPDYRASHPQCFCAVGDIVGQRYYVLRDWLWDACHMVGVRWRSHCKGFCSVEGPHYCFEQSTRKLS